MNGSETSETTSASQASSGSEETRQVYCETCKRHLFHLPITSTDETMQRVYRDITERHASHNTAIYEETIKRVYVRPYSKLERMIRKAGGLTA